MSQHASSAQPPLIRFLFENSLFLVLGALLAFVWVNINPDSYHHFIHGIDLGKVFSRQEEHGDRQSHDAAGNHSPDATLGDHSGAEPTAAPASGRHGVTFHFVVNDVLMALFFAIAAKEVFESLLPGGALSNFRKAATPLMATLGGILGPAFIYIAGAAISGHLGDLARGWAIPCATDIAFSYLIGRLVFGPGHPAIAFLLLLAIADDAAGLIILAVFYPKEKIVVGWLLLAAAGIAAAFALRKLRVQSFWLYLLFPGVMCWTAFYLANLHPALGLVPIIFCMPHAHSDLGIFAREELSRKDTLSEFEHWWKYPVELILGLFGLANAGVELSGLQAGTIMVLAGLILGKPLGITLFTWIADRFLGLEVPVGMNYRHIVVLGMVAAIGFTVALFVADAAFPPGHIQDAAKMGALLSLGAGGLAPLLAWSLSIRPLREDTSEEAPAEPEIIQAIDRPAAETPPAQGDDVTPTDAGDLSEEQRDW